MTQPSRTHCAPHRKTLESQIDRLDHMLDGLSDALNQAVADAVRGTVEKAVRDAVLAVATEIASDLLQKPSLSSNPLRPPAPPNRTVVQNGRHH